jgi:hypothetical protein
MKHCTIHDHAAIAEHICCDCLLEAMGYTPLKSFRSIMWGGPLNTWRKR